MARRRLLPPVLIPLALLAAASVVILLLPFRMIEPDDDDFFYGMHAFARGKVVMTEAEVRELAAIPLPDPTRRGPRMAMGIRVPGADRRIRERSPGHYGLLAALHLVGLDRYANVILAFAVVCFLYHFVRRYVGEEPEAAVLAALLLILNPTFLTMLYRVYMSDFDYFVWATVSLGLYFMARRTGRVWLCVAAGVSLGVSVAFRNTNAIAFLLIVVFELLRHWLRLCEAVRTAAEGVSVQAHAPLGWGRLAGIVAGVVVGLVPLLWYNYVTTGELLGSGYQYRLSRENSACFALWDGRAVFSLRHLFYGEQRGMMTEGFTLSVGLARVLQGYPLVVLAPAGLLLMERRRLRPALFLGLWLVCFWGLYLCYRTIRADSFQFMCRKLSPALAPLAVGAAGALMRMPRRARYATFAAVTFVSLGATGEFFVQFLAPRIRPPGVAGPGRPGPGRRAEPPDALVARAAERLEAGDAREAGRLLGEAAELLSSLPPMAPLDVARAAQRLLPRVRRLEGALARQGGEPLSSQRRAELVGELRRLERELRALPAPLPGRPPGPGGPGIRSPAGPRRPFGEGAAPQELVRRLHRLMAAARARGLDVSRAAELDAASRRAAEAGDWAENRRLLEQAVRAVEQALREAPPRGPSPRR